MRVTETYRIMFLQPTISGKEAVDDWDKSMRSNLVAVFFTHRFSQAVILLASACEQSET